MSHLYGVLGVAAGADRCEIKSAFWSLAKTWHPDLPCGDAQRFKEISQAYTVLANPARRAAYDAECALIRAGVRRRWANAMGAMTASFVLTFSSGMAVAGWLLGT